ncbi:hypothetical protein [Amnibacterium kyonggiense]|uniref:Uncharacterized protein n=1 Tax=Amnibacterium kyonggiense TaxID=595671 RepID=A0A4R7FQ54_9MICO|nr:hypothetical protein [Amnibacterium kyonggiense]TDS79902.1 hypothetical protein CLV52_0448 [Amnibacterium kyonggiense]
MTTATDAPPRETTPVWDALIGVVFPGLLLSLVYDLAGTWSMSQTFGGEGDSGWVDFDGHPIDHPPILGNATLTVAPEVEAG